MGSIRRSNGGLFPRRWERCLSSELFEEEEEEEEEDDVHVLAVDDSLVDRKVIERLLKITSCKVTTVESGWRALQYLGLIDDQDYYNKTTSSSAANHHHDFNVNVNEQEEAGMNNKVDLIITDYCMPGMTGYELLKKIKGSATFREIPVVIMSSENVVARIHRCLEEGAEDFIVKPVKLSDVKRLKDYMFGGDNRPATIPAAAAAATTNNIIINNKQEEKTISSFNKRKLQEMSPSSSPSTSPTMSPCTSQSPPPTTASSPPSSSSSSLSSSTPPMSPDPISPSQLESPTMRLKVTNSSDQV